MLAHLCNPGTWKMEELGIQGQYYFTESLGQPELHETLSISKNKKAKRTTQLKVQQNTRNLNYKK